MTSNGVNGTTEPLERNGSPAVRPKSPPIQSPAANPSLVPPKSSPTLEGKDLGVRSPLANGDRPDSSGTDRDAPNDSEAETVVLNGEESPHKKQGKAVKHERDDEDEDLARRKKMAKSEPASSSKHSEPERRRSTEPEKPSSKPRLASEKSDAKRNGLSRSENSGNRQSEPVAARTSKAQSWKGAEPASNEQLHSPKTEPPNSPGSRTKLQERSSSTVETKKRKIREEHHLKNIEPPRQRHRSDGPGKDSAVHSLRNQPTSPPTPNGRPHRRSLSTQTVQQPLAQTRKRRDVANLNIHDHDRYSDSSSETSSSPRPQHQAVPRLKRSSHRALTSPVRGMPPKKNIDRFGATRLARDCEKGDLELVKQDFELAPEELDQVDFAGIAPLQKAALNGHADVVEFLIKKGCRTDCMSSDHDTPLIDATENGHVDVVRLLLEVGHVNPHHQNRKGQRALDAIDEDNEETAEELKALLNEYMLKEPLEENDSAKSTTLAQAMQSESASNLLYNEYNVETLRDKAAEGDVGAVAQLISADIKPNNACGIAASRGGHDDVLSLLLAVGLKADPDPAKHSETPMTVAIGRGHLKVITLLLDQDNFDPTRRNREGKTYWELSEERRGPRWQQERELLKLRYDSHKTQRSPNSRRRQAGQAASSSKHLKREQEAPSRMTKVKTESLENGKSSVPKAAEQVPHKARGRLISGKELSREREKQRRRRRVAEDSSDSEVEETKSEPRRTASGSSGKSSNMSPESKSSPVKPLSPAESKEDDDIMEDDPPLSSKRSGVPLEKESKRHQAQPPVTNSPEPVAVGPSAEERRKAEIIAEKEKEKAEKAELEARIKSEQEARLKVEQEARDKAELEAKKKAEEEAAAEQARLIQEKKAREEEEERIKQEKEQQEQARKQQEEEYARQKAEQARREEEEARAAAEQAKLESERQERERMERVKRLEALPRALKRALKLGPNRPLHFRGNEMGISVNFLPVHTVSLSDIDPNCDPATKNEAWMLNFQAVGILGLPELALSEYPDWKRRDTTMRHRERFLESYDLAQLAQDVRFPVEGTKEFNLGEIMNIMKETREKFLSMEPLFWVRFDDFEKVVPHYNHLDGLNSNIPTVTCHVDEVSPVGCESFLDVVLGKAVKT